MKWKKILTMVILMVTSATAFAQEVEMADKMRSNGRIYVVVAVVLTILLGLILYIVRIDRKLRKIERENN